MQDKTYILTGTEQISSGGRLSGRSFAQSTEALIAGATQQELDSYIENHPDPAGAAKAVDAAVAQKQKEEIIKEADRKTSSRNLSRPAALHPMHGALKRIIHVRMADGSTKPMKVKTALQKGYIKSS